MLCIGKLSRKDPEEQGMSAVQSVKAFIEVVQYKLKHVELDLKEDAPDNEFIIEMARAD